MKFVAKIIVEIETVVNDVSLMDRQDRVAGRNRAIWHHAVIVDGYESWRVANLPFNNFLSVLNLRRSRTPLRKPEIILLYVEQNAV